MNYVTHNNGAVVNLGGTSKVGVLSATFADICAKFGNPLRYPRDADQKVRASWIIKFEDGDIAEIHDYTNHDIPLEDLKIWSIGGHTDVVAGRIKAIMRPVKGMLVSVLRDSRLGDCSAGGVSSKADTILLVGDGIPGFSMLAIIQF